MLGRDGVRILREGGGGGGYDQNMIIKNWNSVSKSLSFVDNIKNMFSRGGTWEVYTYRWAPPSAAYTCRNN